ncbi:hypothetical protein F4808DRAFT_463377 [Astrocystis sublimbata]|nr:hypothetical protein F4808DRAFT_463377 [Astrocystis sublimbata]
MPELMEMARVTLFGSRNAGNGVDFEPARDIPSLAGKVILITGAAGDLGRSTAVELARHGHPARIYVADLPRSEEEKKEVVDRIQREARGDASDHDRSETTEVRFLELNLTSFESIQKCAAEFVAQEDRLDILILNAGIIRVRLGLTSEGYETHFGLNYVGHALLSKLLLPTLLRTKETQAGADVRVVVVSSEGHAIAPAGGIQFDKVRTGCRDMTYSQRYGQSKLALIGFARELARHHPDLTMVAVHPGRILTGMADSLATESLLVRYTRPIAQFICVPVSVGIRNHLWAATSSDVVSGKYYEPVGVPGKESKLALDESLSQKLWEWTESELGAVSSPSL